MLILCIICKNVLGIMSIKTNITTTTIMAGRNIYNFRTYISIPNLWENNQRRFDFRYDCVKKDKSGKNIHRVFHSLTLFFTFQPSLVNDQLDQLYLDLELEGLSARLSIGESSSSGSSGDEENSLKMRKKRFKYGSIVMIYEENAPLPPNS